MILFGRGALTFHRRPLVVVHDRNLSSRTMSFRTLVVEVEVATDIVMVEAVSVHCPDFLAAGCIDWMGAAGFLYQKNS